MELIKTNNISSNENRQIKMNGWVYNTRRSGKIGFLIFRDGFGMVQCIVAKNDVGENNFDICTELGIQPLARLYTFGKAMGCHGAIWITSQFVKNYLINFSRPFIYTTALPPHSLATILSSFRFLKKDYHLFKILNTYSSISLL